MPTYNRRRFLRTAIRCFLEQDWPEKELVVIDDGTDKVEDVFRDVPNCRYFYHLEAGLPAHRPHATIGTKRNLACEFSHGEVIVHWDDDDWSAPGRITDQVTRLLESGKAVSGYHSMLFWDERGTASKVLRAGEYSVGSALCYRRDFWEKKRFLNTSQGEDNSFVDGARSNIISVDAGQFMVARTHGSNTDARSGVGSGCWPKVDTSAIPPAFFEAIRV
jgi:glycosyltransferase involved in cell wall biosynthesis